MWRFGNTNVAKEECYGSKKPTEIWDVNFDDIVFSKLIERKTNFKYLIGYLDEVIRPLVLILPKISRYVKTLTEDEDKDKNNKFMSFFINDGKLLKKTHLDYD